MLRGLAPLSLVVAAPLCCVLLAPGMPALAADGRTPIWEPTTITEPGAYYLARDLVSDGNKLITIAASGVDLDLAGHALSGPGLGTGVSIAPQQERVRIHDGVFRSLGDGIEASQARAIVVEHVRCEAGFRCVFVTNSDTTIVRDCQLSGTGPVLYLIDTRPAIVERNLIETTGSIEPARLLSTDSVRAEDNASVLATNRAQIYTSGNAVWIRSNRVIKTSGFVALSTGGPGSVAEENVVSGGWLAAAEADTVVAGNIVRDNVSVVAALDLRGVRPLVEDNLISANAGDGIVFQPGTADGVLRRNVARGNTFADFSDFGVNNSTSGDNFVPLLY
ncbi:MAG: right-handed parallel beta-helix repeat-containing protein [Acidobacteria bacterium]|nr:right-handed parallel beta-helix repeat-containing protein [Acidobacteriota bacterium]